MIEPIPHRNFDPLASLRRPVQLGMFASVLCGLYSLSLPNYYRSEARLLPVESKGATSGMGALTSTVAALGIAVPGAEGVDANFVDVLNSRWIREQLLMGEFQFHHRTWRFGSERFEKKRLYDFLQVENLDRGANALGGILSASRDQKSKLITVTAETTSPELSKQIVQRAINLLESFLLEKGRTRGSAKVAFTEARLVASRKDLDEAEKSYESFLYANRNHSTSGDPAVRLKAVRLETELRLHQQLVSSIALSREQAMLEEKNDMPLLNVLDAGNLPFEKNKPNRSSMVIFSFLMVGTFTWIWMNREMVIYRITGSTE